MASVIINVIVSLFTKPDPLEKLYGLVYGLVMKDDKVQKAIENRIKGDE